MQLSPKTRSALHANQFDLEDQRRIGRDDPAGAAGAVAEVGGNEEGALAAGVHGGDALVPSLDDAAHAERKLERLAAVARAVEFLALGAVLIEPARVMHHAGLAGLGRRAGADLGVRDLQSRWCRHGAPGALRHCCGRDARPEDGCYNDGEGGARRSESSPVLLLVPWFITPD